MEAIASSASNNNTTTPNHSVNNTANHDSQLSKYETVNNNGYKPSELIRLLLQTLRGYGLEKSASALEEESGILQQSVLVTNFMEALKAGNWPTVIKLLPGLISNETSLTNAKGLIYRQKFLELLESSKLKEALECLRNELTPLSASLSKKDFNLHQLSSLIMCTDKEEMKKKANWEGSTPAARNALLTSLQVYIPSNLLIPTNRMETLLLQAFEAQKNRCVYHNTNSSHREQYSLFSDHKCEKERIPKTVKHVLDKHTDEVWYIKFSNNGKYLASASRDTTLIVWELTPAANGNEEDFSVNEKWIFTGHNQAISYLSWSPNDRFIVSCSNDHTAKLWNVEKGECVATMKNHKESVTASVWLPDSIHFFTSAHDHFIYLWDIFGNQLKKFPSPIVRDMLISNDAKQLIVLCHEKKIRIYSITGFDIAEIDAIQEKESPSALALSNDNQILVTVARIEQVHLWDLKERALVQKYSGHKQGMYVIRACFGGNEQNFILCGSEDSQVYIWHRKMGTLLEVLPGHSGSVNSVSWNPTNPYMFASASDDHTIRIWTA